MAMMGKREREAMKRGAPGYHMMDGKPMKDSDMPMKGGKGKSGGKAGKGKGKGKK